MESKEPTSGGASHNLEYERRLLAFTLDWYRSADSKAQVLLTLDGAFVAFLTATIFKRPQDLKPILDHFRPDTWIFMTLMSLTLVGSMSSALWSLWSRIALWADMVRWFKRVEPSPARPQPSDLWFFQSISRLRRDRFIEAIGIVDENLEREILANDIFDLSRNVTRKHKLVNIGFVLAGATVLLFLAGGVSYVLNARG